MEDIDWAGVEGRVGGDTVKERGGCCCCCTRRSGLAIGEMGMFTAGSNGFLSGSGGR